MMSGTPPARRYGGKSLEQRREERRSRLLDAGLELFGTQGFQRTTIEQLCATARLNPRYFYEQFATREELLGAVYERHVQAVAAQVVAALERAPAEPAGRLRAGLEAFLEASLADERAARINYFEVVGVSAELERKRRGVLADYAELIAAQLARFPGAAQTRLGEPRLAAVALTGATDGLIIDWLAGERRNDREAIIATLLDIFGSVLSP
jgi:AcrR family transcriptional regulator